MYKPLDFFFNFFLPFQVTTDTPNVASLPNLLVSLGMTPISAVAPPSTTPLLAVILDGRIIGEMEEKHIKSLANKLRTLKALGEKKVRYPQQQYSPTHTHTHTQ